MRRRESALPSRENFFHRLLHANFNNVDGSLAWASGISQTLPPSFYLSAQPSWWGSLPFPATGPDVSGGSGPGGHSYGNPAQACYLNTMGGSDGGAGGPLPFNAEKCYGGGTASQAPEPATKPHRHRALNSFQPI